MDNYVTDYEKAILDGKIQACRKIKQAVKRDQKDLRKSKNTDFPYYFDNEFANRAIEFVEILPTASGDPLKLEPFQKWLLGMLFGWRKKKDKTEDEKVMAEIIQHSYDIHDIKYIKPIVEYLTA